MNSLDLSLSLKDLKFLDIAKSMSAKSTLKSKHGALFVSKNKIISKGYNHNRCIFGGSYKINDRENSFKKHMNTSNCCACHAEMDVLYKAILNIPLKSSLFKTKLKKSLFLQV